MKKYDTIFLDRDGTLNPDPGYISSIQDFKFFDFTLTALKELKDICKRFCIISNQSGIGRGLIDIKDLSEIHSYILNFCSSSISACNLSIAYLKSIKSVDVLISEVVSVV